MAPTNTNNNLTEFKKSCDVVLENIMVDDINDSITFIGFLNNIQDYLTQELEYEDVPCMAYFLNESILQKIVDLVNKDLPPAHVEPLFSFFMAFVTTGLNKYFAQIHIHRPFTQLLSKLETIYLIDGAKTSRFAVELWNKLKVKPVYLEMMTDGHSYPLIDFFCTSALIPEKEHNYARDIILSIMFPSEDSLPDIFPKYIEEKFYPQISDFIIATIQCVTTIQFKGSLTSLLSWVDQLLQLAKSFDSWKVIQEILKLSASQQMLGFSFLLSYFSAPVIHEKVLEISVSKEVLQTVAECLNSNDDTSQISGLVFLKTLLTCDCDFSFLLPPKPTEACDVLSNLPVEWLIQCDGSTSMESYQSDAVSRVLFFDGIRKDGNNKELFEQILGLLKRFNSISLTVCLSVTQLITEFVSIAPDLISKDLVDAYAVAIKQYANVPFFEMPNEKSSDCPEVRAAILAEFGKEIHTTFIAYEKIRSASSSISQIEFD
ncbi:hypothetical protein GPJ56_007834 [Histomonas meleagridis]|uniref:uncharacterized protein n=1 Tax=Histomonas meleagridis TaxID=135588 RepID=UPI00355A65BA|nr:hypothetical protein GPJ56_007834 [Histomonas meleagridis]KAH0800265.1 hypothetical protein GO595_007377 [Histomonas meleagridis]